jgi:hypothetical protein
MRDAFAKAHLPQPTPQTAFLAVEASREERDPATGGWVNAVSLPALAIHATNPHVPDAEVPLQRSYLAWAELNQGAILQPAFYAVTKADPWRPPGGPVKVEVDLRQELLERERQALEEEMGDAAASARDMRRFQRFLEGRRRTPRQPTGGGAARPAQVEFVQVGHLPEGAFDPLASQPDVVMMVHDDQTEPGKTYRYRVRYAIKNPLYQYPEACENPDDAAIFAVWSEYSNWSAPIKIPLTTNFYVLARDYGTDAIRFEIFKWERGVTHSLIDKAAPGDDIGQKENNADFTTGWTVVDVLQKEGELQVIVMDADGNTRSRSSRDIDTPEYKQLQGEVRKAEAANEPTPSRTYGVLGPR